MNLSNNTLLQSGKYKILSLISQDNFSFTYEAINTTFQSKVTIKEFFITSCCEREADGNIKVEADEVNQFATLKEKFIEEGKFLFNHPSSIQVTDLFGENGTSYYVIKNSNEHPNPQKINLSEFQETESPSSQQNKSECKGKGFKEIAKERNILTNIILVVLQIAATAAALLLFFSGGAFSLLGDPKCTFLYVYGKGFLPAFLLSLGVVIGNSIVLKGKQSGYYIMHLLLLLIMLPLMWNEYMEYIAFYSCGIAALIVYFLVLQFRKNGQSAWKTSEPCSWMNSKGIFAILGFYIFSVIILPPLVGKWNNFSDSYAHGLNIIDAHLNSHSFYANRLAEEIAYSKDYYGMRHDCEPWFEKAIKLDKNSEDPDLDNYFSYIEYLLFSNQASKARNVYQQARDEFNKNQVDDYIDNHIHGEWDSFFRKVKDPKRKDELIRQMLSLKDAESDSYERVTHTDRESQYSNRHQEAKPKEIVVRHVHEPQ